jgi:hypothetical protein
MARFDLGSFSQATGRSGGDLLGTLGVQYGVPTCMMNLGRDLLSLLPSDMLGSLGLDMQGGRNLADASLKSFSQKLRNLTGIMEFDTDEGVFSFVGDGSQYGQDGNNPLGSFGEFLGAALTGLATGASIYNNINTAVAGFEGMVQCVSDYNEYMKGVGGEAGNRRADLGAVDPSALQTLLAEEYGPQIQAAREARAFIETVDNDIDDINSIISERIKNPDLEPSYVGSPALDSSSSVFRLNFGPPESKLGRFLLSVDGLYYDSQTSGITPALLELETRDAERDPSLDWMLEYDPNLGGRGIPQTMEELNQYYDTIFDPNNINEASGLQRYYDADNTLVNIIGQRNRKIYDVSAELQQHIDANSSQAIIDNLKQVMISESARFMSQINRRKKQIELAVRLPAKYGSPVRYKPGEVPVNDFSYLAGTNYALSLEKQRNIVIRQDEVKGVVLPIETKFEQQIQTYDNVRFGHLIINSVPNGVTIDSVAASASTSASIAATPEITTDGLFALYNYLTLETSQPSSTNYGLRNSTEEGISNNAQLVGDSSEILKKGLGIPYLSGIAIPDDTGGIQGAGSYVKLPPLGKFQDLLYNKAGATFETWVHVPELSSVDSYNHTANVSGLYRLVLANENTGDSVGDPDIVNMFENNSVQVSQGLIIGFTRDRRFTQTKAPSNLEADNPVEDVSLVIAPTRSFDSSSVGFIANKLDLDSCQSASSWKGLVIPVSSVYQDTTLSSCASSFCQLSVVFNPVKDEIKVYLDGVNLATSSYTDVFGVSIRKETPRVPSINVGNNFEYNTTNIAASSLEAYQYGPKLDPYFTPWILGGGYTDGNPNGNFMGGEYGGKISGLKGYLGCTRFYSKPLSGFEILDNYKATQNFFKNIRI